MPAFSASADFAIDKPAGQRCPNLQADHRCAIHDRLRSSGFAGCAVFDCFGAGQRATELGKPEVFPGLRALHELMFYVSEALGLPSTRPLHDALRATLEELERTDPAEVDRGEVNALLLQASALARAERPGPERRGADLMGADLRRTDLRGASLRGAWLIGADLRGVDLAGADLTGADLRGADLRGADLSGSLFVSQPQLDAALGDTATKVPPRRNRPDHWA